MQVDMATMHFHVWVFVCISAWLKLLAYKTAH